MPKKDTKAVNNGDQLRNTNSRDYLAQFKDLIPDILELNTLPIPIKSVLTKIQTALNADNPNYPFGDLYTNFLKTLEKYLPPVWDEFSANEHLKALINRIYDNPNKALENSAASIEKTVAASIQTQRNFPANITEHLATGSEKINQTSPTKEGSLLHLIRSLLSRNFKPQMSTGMASVRSYNHTKLLPYKELRFGTQGQRHQGKVRNSPLFKLWLKQQQNPNQPKAVTHVYFNYMALDKSPIDYTRNQESKLSEALLKLEDEHPNLAVICLPGHGGIMSKNLLRSQQTCTLTDAKAYIKKIATRGREYHQEIQSGVAVTHDYYDFFISDAIKLKLADTERFEDLIDRLINQSIKKMGLQEGTISAEQLQALFFHFSKYELTRYILEKLKPQTFNMSCKDAIDRGASSSAYYNLLLSIELNQPMTCQEFNQALHASAALVKGRGMNFHSRILWNAIDKYLAHNEQSAPAWLMDWHLSNCPKEKAKALLTAKITRIIKDFPRDEDPIYNQARLILEKTKDLMEHASPGAYGLLYQTALQTELLIKAKKKNPQTLPLHLQRYQSLYKKVDKHYSSLGKCLLNLIKLLGGLVSTKIEKSRLRDKQAKALSREQGVLLNFFKDAEPTQRTSKSTNSSSLL